MPHGLSGGIWERDKDANEAQVESTKKAKSLTGVKVIYNGKASMTSSTEYEVDLIAEVVMSTYSDQRKSLHDLVDKV